MSHSDIDAWPQTARIPADIDQPDKILAGLTARQMAILAVAAVVIWAGWAAARRVVTLPEFAALAAPIALAAVALVIGVRDGLTLDRLLAAAWRHARSPRRLVPAPEGVPPAALGDLAPSAAAAGRHRSRRCGATSRADGVIGLARRWPPPSRRRRP